MNGAPRELVLELTRTAGERRRYVLDGVGALRLDGVLSPGATAETATGQWRFGPRGLWQRQVEAVTAAGTWAGEFAPHGIRRGGVIHWGARDLTLLPAGPLREHYTLAEGGRELARLDGRSWGHRPVTARLSTPGAVDPGLLLFACFLVRRLARSAGDSSSASTSAAAGAGC